MIGKKLLEQIIDKKAVCSAKRSIDSIQCCSIKSTSESYLPCLLNAISGQKYCAIHLAQKKIIDYTPLYQIEDNVPCVSNFDTVNPIIKKIDIVKEYAPIPFIKKTPVIINKDCDTKKTTKSTMHEQKTSTIERHYKETEEDLETKLLILISDEYGNKISELVGPVFQDITLSEDDMDPMTFDSIWTIENGIKVPASINKYYLFSWIDSKCKVRCLTIFTVYNMILEQNLVHPITREPISDNDIIRAIELINFYQKKIRLFDEEEDTSSPEFKLKNKLTLLFKKFHKYNVYLEEKWILDIDNKKDLYQIISETNKLISSNIRSINPKLSKSDLFNNKKTSCDSFELKTYIIDEWIKLIHCADNPENQLPMWILASGLSCVVPEIKKKYPDIDYMMS